MEGEPGRPKRLGDQTKPSFGGDGGQRGPNWRPAAHQGQIWGIRPRENGSNAVETLDMFKKTLVAASIGALSISAYAADVNVYGVIDYGMVYNHTKVESAVDVGERVSYSTK